MLARGEISPCPPIASLGQGVWLKFAGFALSRLAKFFGLGEDRAAYDPNIENRHIEGPL
jgi:hypothetical protein